MVSIFGKISSLLAVIALLTSCSTQSRLNKIVYVKDRSLVPFSDIFCNSIPDYPNEKYDSLRQVVLLKFLESDTLFSGLKINYEKYFFFYNKENQLVVNFQFVFNENSKSLKKLGYDWNNEFLITSGPFSGTTFFYNYESGEFIYLVSDV